MLGSGRQAEILDGLREHGHYDWDGFSEYLDTQQEALAAAAASVEERRTALLCYELRPEECHRRIVAQYLGDIVGFGVTHL